MCIRDRYNLTKFMRSNQGTLIHHKPLVSLGDRVSAGQVIADGSSTSEGELALGRNLLVAFMPFDGYNFEDAIVVSERLVKDDLLSSIHIHEYEVDARSTKLGEEEITRDIPNRSEESLRDLDDRGIVRFVADALRFYMQFHSRSDGFYGAFIHDALAVAAAARARPTRPPGRPGPRPRPRSGARPTPPATESPRGQRRPARS